tara:strand:- start:214 stop:945 length:732 start_codon:yes stop_codon:yes gene_type:complete
MNKARGMPSVAISKQTEDRLSEEAQLNTKKSEAEIFNNPNMKLDIKPVEKLNDNNIKSIDETKPVKPKKKLTEKQLEALARGRQKSIETRKAKKAEKDKELAQKQQNIVKPKPFVYEEPNEIPTQPQQQRHYQPQPQQIDYDKIISGVASVYEERLSQKKQAELEAQQKADAINNQVQEFEGKIREDERRKVREEYAEELRQKKQAQAHKITQKVLSTPNDISQQNPYSYAFNMGARNRYNRY